MQTCCIPDGSATGSSPIEFRRLATQERWELDRRRFRTSTVAYWRKLSGKIAYRFNQRCRRGPQSSFMRCGATRFSARPKSGSLGGA